VATIAENGDYSRQCGRGFSVRQTSLVGSGRYSTPQQTTFIKKYNVVDLQPRTLANGKECFSIFHFALRLVGW